jgi:hypothetical protein
MLCNACVRGMTGRMEEVLSKPQQRMDQREVAVAYYTECLSLFSDLCAGRNEYAVSRLIESSALALTYEGIIGAVQSSHVPPENRSRLCDLLQVLYVDR